MYHLHVLFFVMALVYIYAIVQSGGLPAHPVVLLPVIRLPAANALRHFEIVFATRSYGTEYLALGGFLLMVSIVGTNGSFVALGVACFCLGLASFDNPLHLIHIAGFALGVCLYFRDENRAQTLQVWFTRDQWVALGCGLPVVARC